METESLSDQRITLRFHLIPFRMANIRYSRENSCMQSSSIASGSANLYKHSGNQFGDFSENSEYMYHKTQLHHSWAYTQKKLNYTTSICTYATMRNFNHNSQKLEITWISLKKYG